MRRSGVFPDFMKVRALNEYEAGYLRRMIPQAEITCVSYPKIGNRESEDCTVLVASIYGPMDQMNLVVPFLEWCESASVRVFVRLHPREAGDFWQSIARRFSVSIERSNESIIQAFDRIQPAIVVSWFSTALVDALNHGLVPAMLCGEDEDSVRDLIYPLTKLSLNWPRDKSIMEQALRSGEFRVSLADQLRSSTL